MEALLIIINCIDASNCQLHLSSAGYNAVLHALGESRPGLGWVGVTLCPLFLREYLDTKGGAGGDSGVCDTTARSVTYRNF